MRIWLFRTIALSIPVLFFVALEAGLRLGGYGRDVPLFIDNPAHPGYILPRPDIVKRYFAEDAAVPNVTMEANFLLKEKPQNGLRIFVQGGSSAAGFPYGLGASLAGMLDNRLKRTFPDRYVEVVNTAMAAVNSYTLLDLADEIIEQEPDAVLIYAGHNEYLGILGVGSNYTAANSQSTTLLFLKLKSLRIFQLAQQVYQAVMGPSAGETNETAADSSRTFMAKVAKHKDIPLDSELYHAGLQQLETNLNLLLEKYQQANVPVYIATVASNLRDQPPFATRNADEALERTFRALVQQAQSNQGAVKKAQLDNLIADAEQSTSAQFHFKMAHMLLKLNQFEQAKAFFERARDFDLLRFRAPSASNEVIRKVAQTHGAHLVDVEARLNSQSEHGIVGRNFMLEHLHLNVQGYFLLADTFYQSLKQHQELGKWHHIDTATAWKQRLLIPSEEYNGFAKVQRLMADYPFSKEPKQVQLPKPADWQQQLGHDHYIKKLDWLSMMRRAMQGYQREGDAEMMLKSMLIIAEALPHDAKANATAGHMLMRAKQSVMAVHYFRRAKLAGDTSAQLAQALEKAITATQAAS